MDAFRDNVKIDVEGDYWNLLQQCGGYYSCKKDGNGKRLGPLVGYAGKYTASDGQQKQWVGDIYANFAKIEEYPGALHYCAVDLAKLSTKNGLVNHSIFCGAPLGGYALADKLGFVTGNRVIKAEKKVISLATPDTREKSEIVFGRHAVEPKIAHTVVEDVCNNFSTTEELISKIYQFRGTVVGIVCFLNRSSIGMYYPKCVPGYGIPVFSLIRQEIKEYRQDDPEVIDDVVAGNVVWKPKEKWDFLMSNM